MDANTAPVASKKVEMITTDSGESMTRDAFMKMKIEELRANGGAAVAQNTVLAALAQKEREKQAKKALKRDRKELKKNLAKERKELATLTPEERAKREKALLKKQLQAEKKLEEQAKAAAVCAAEAAAAY